MKDNDNTTRYLIKSSIETEGVVEKPDVVGAVFGQTEGILDEDLDLRELQKNGKIGRINVNVKSEKGKSRGTISIPSSLDKKNTSMIGAALETVDRVGPCEANVDIDEIQDTRETKRHFIEKRAEELEKSIEGSDEEVKKRPSKKKSSPQRKNVVKYKGQPAGPSAARSDAIIVVEGRSDVINLLESNIKNTVALEGTSVPSVIPEITKKKTATAFLDGDRGGSLILKELLQVADIDYVARAPEGKTVEDLPGKEVREALKGKVPAEKADTSSQGKKETPEETDQEKLAKTADELQGTLNARLLDKDLEKVKEIKVRELSENIEDSEGVKAIAFDGVVTQNLANLAEDNDLEYLVGMKDRVENKPENVKIMTLESLQ